MNTKPFTKKELYLISKDKNLAKIIRKNGSISFSRKKQDPFNNLIGIIISQFISTKAADGIKNNILNLFNKKQFEINSFKNLNVNEIKALGLSTNKARSVKEVTNYFLHHKVIERIYTLDQKEREAELLRLFGIGRWSVEMFEMFAVRNVNVFSSGDAALRSVMIENNMVQKNANLNDFENYAKIWSPFKTIASLHLWKSID